MAKRDSSDRGWLLTAFAASTTAFAVGMLTFDGFSFIQVTFLSFVLIGLGEVALRVTADATETARARATAPRRPLMEQVRAGIAAGTAARADGR